MAIRFRCPHCGRAYRVAAASGGRQVRCKECRRRIIIPEAVPPALPDTEPGLEVEYSESGKPIYRHGPRRSKFTPPPNADANRAQIAEHIEKHIGKIATVFHELVSDLVHIDLHLVEPTDDRPYHTLITSGMSDLPMHVPEGAEECRFAELLISLPPDWPLAHRALENECHYWPLRWLKMLARFPHEYETWLWYGHSIPNGDPPQPLADNTDLCCALLLSPALVPDDFLALRLTDEKTIHFFGLLPLFAEEVEFKLKHGADALAERLAEQGVTELLDLSRPRVFKRRPR